MLTDWQRTQWFRQAKYGLFFHWGLLSVTGRDEWSFLKGDYTVAEYAEIAASFQPVSGFADAWAGLAVNSGAAYTVLTTRHHDGFCLWNSRTTDFTASQTAAGRDLVREYVDACRAAGVKVGLYYSLTDWRYKGAWDARRYPESATAMVNQAHAQVRELLTKYGKIDVLWYDGAGSLTGDRDADIARFWRSQELWEMALDLQPEIVINTRSGYAGDFQTPEHKITPDEGGGAWESCLTVDATSWGYVAESPASKTAGQIVNDMLRIAAGGGNLLLNTGPDRHGRIRPYDESVLLKAGQWRKRFAGPLAEARAQSLFGELEQVIWWASPVPCVWYLATKAWPGTEVWYPRIDGDILSVRYADTNENVNFARGPHGRLMLRTLPPACPDPLGVIFRVEFAAPPQRLAGGYNFTFGGNDPHQAEVIDSNL